MSTIDEVARVAPQFQIEGELVACAGYGNGHINQTHLAIYRSDRGESQYVHQKINDAVFGDIPALMSNVGRVTRCAPGLTPRLIPTREGEDALHALDGSWWRTYAFVPNARTYDFPDSPKRAYATARAFGAFIRALKDIDGKPLHETIANFHDTPSRLIALADALTEDPLRRAADVKDEVAFCFAHESLAQRLEILRRGGLVAECVTHNDTKINNVLIDDRTGDGVCVIDLDTVMPGIALYDFGDIVRTATMPIPEDERDLSLARVDPALFESVARGFIDGASDAITSVDIEHFVTAGKVIALEIGVRFLTDHLCGDRYFRIRRAGQNLDRARTQFALVRSLAENEDALQSLIPRR